MKIDTTSESLFKEFGEIIININELPNYYLKPLNSIVQNDMDMSLEQIKEWNDDFEVRILKCKQDYKRLFINISEWRDKVENFLLSKLEENV